MSLLQTTINQLTPLADTINIVVPAGSDTGASVTCTITFSVTDSDFLAGGPDLTLSLSLGIRESDQYTFKDGTALKKKTVTMSGGVYNGSFRFVISNAQPMGAIPLPFNLNVCAFDQAVGPGQQSCDVKFVTVTKA